MLDAVDRLSGYSARASELNILCKNNIEMCTFNLEPGVFSMRKARSPWETSVGVEAGLWCDPATAGPGKTDLLWDRAASAQNRSRSHRLSLCAENFTRLGD